jgi:clan AA aspartic protease (TIGR02281 family)
MGLSMRVILWACVFLLLQVPWGWGKIYKWTDDNGKVHFTDNPATIPDAYHNQIETHASHRSASDDLVPRQVRSQPTPSHAARPPQAFVVPLRRTGNALLVQVTIDGFVRAPLMVDTGASFTVIATQTAQRLGLNLHRAATIPMRSASGVFFAHFTKVRSIKVGDAVVKDVEVVVHDISPGREQGLLGMSFLDHFNVTIHTLQDAMDLTPLDQVAGMPLYDGKPQSWWQNKFRFYRRQVSYIDTYVADDNSPQLEQSRRYFQSELAMLERRARLASVPRAWRY